MENIIKSGYLNKFFWIIVILIILKISIKIIRKYADNLQKVSYLDQKKKTLIPVFYQIIRGVLWFLAACLILEVLDISATPVLAITGALSVVVGVGAQQVIKDVINGFLILTENQFNIGDEIGLGTVHGMVLELGLRTTKLRDLSTGEVYIIPNSEIKIVKNASSDYLIAKVEVTLSTTLDSKKVLKLIETVISEFYIEGETLEAPTLRGITKLSKESMVITVTCKVETSKKKSVESKILSTIKLAIDKNLNALTI